VKEEERNAKAVVKRVYRIKQNADGGTHSK
jgi:hypothetical protein